MKKAGLLLFAVFLMPGILFAGETPRLYSGIRPLGMGNAFITLSDDSNALFFNPAGLNDIDHFSMDLIGIQVEVGQNSIDAFSDVTDLNDTLDDVNNTEADNIQATTTFLQGIIGENQHIRASTFTSSSFHNFAFGAVGQGSLDLIARNRSNPSINTDITVDYGPVGGAAFSLYDKALQIGVSGKFIQRMGFVESFSVIDLASDNFDPFKNLDEVKSDFSFDIGLKYNFKNEKYKPSIGLVVQNLTDLDFEELGIIPQTFNIGAGIKPKIWFLDTAFVAQYDDVAGESDSDIFKRLHFGMELKFPKVLVLRAGLNQGWTTYGASANLWLFKFDVASYSEEIGEYAGQKEDKRLLAQFSIGWNT